MKEKNYELKTLADVLEAVNEENIGGLGPFAGAITKKRASADQALARGSIHQGCYRP
jgi:hypothetical protein